MINFFVGHSMVDCGYFVCSHLPCGK